MHKNYKLALANLNENQRAAVDQIDGPLLVLAGPGTGKTQLLSTRVAHILATTDTNPENILCLTFTDSGAANMRARLTSLIGRPAAKVHISTYHSFGRTLLDAYANYAEHPPRLFDSPITNVQSYKIFAKIQSDLAEDDILKSAKISDLISVVRELKSARLTPENVRAIAEINLEISARLNSEIFPLLSHLIPRKYAENLPIYTETLAKITDQISDKPIIKNIERETNFLARDLAHLVAESKTIGPLSKWKDKHFEKDATGNYRLKNLIANKKLLSLANVMQKYQKTLEAENLFDYADMIEQAITYLKTDRGFRLTLQELYQFILLDEFQDTNPSQFDLVKLLTDYESPNVMAVGDDDQAIMEFQGAEASNLLDFQTHYNAKVITLTDNYRSTQPLLDFSRKIANQITDSFSKAHKINKSLTSHSDQETTITRHQFLAAPSEYHWLSDEVAKLISAGIKPDEIAVITPKHKYIPSLLPHLSNLNIPVAYEKRENVLEDERIASLLKLARFVYFIAAGHQASHLILELLSAPYWNLNTLSIIEALDEAHRHNTNALTYLKTSKDENLSRLATFFADLVGASFDTPLELFLDYLTGAAPLGDFRSPFLDFYSDKYDRSFARPFSNASSPAKPDTYIPDVTDGFAQSAVPSADQRMTWQVEAGAREKAARETQYSLFTLYENLSVLKEALMTHVKTETPKLKDLIVMLDDYAAAKEPLTNTSPYQTAESAVHILSAHKAKGLEFSHVFLISVDDAAWGNATGNNNTFTLPKNLAHIRHTGITEDERLRLFFVAITRAKTHLYLTSSGRDFSGKAPTPLEYLEEADNLSPLLPEKTQKIIIHDHDDPDPAPLKTHWSLRYAPESPDLTHILKKKLENYRLTPTDLTTFVDIVYAGPLTFYAEKLLGSPRPPLEPKQAYGNFVHAVLDFGTKNKTTDDTALFDLYKTLVGASVFSAGEKSALLAKGTLNLPKILHKLSPNFRAPSTLSEVNFKSEHVAVDGVPITGNIDQLLIDEPTKTITIVDFKTTSFDPQKSWTNSPRLLMYRLQLGFYKLLLNNSPKYKNYHVATALLEHLNPNDDGEIITRPYNFNAGDEEELKSLITSVYTHIKSLDFPPLHPDADYTLKDIKDFIASLIA